MHSDRASSGFTILSIGVALSSILAFAYSFLAISSHQHIANGMHRIAAAAVQGHLNRFLLITIAGLLVLNTVLVLVRVVWRSTARHMVFINALCMLTVFVLLSIDVLLRYLTSWTMPSAARSLVAKIGVLVTGALSVDDVLYIFEKHGLAVVLLAVAIPVTLIVVWLLIKRFGLPKIDGRFIYLHRFGCLCIVFIVIINVALFVDERSLSSERPNVILIVCDALRADHLGCYGYQRNTSTHIDSFAARATIFTNAYVQTPCTNPSMRNLVTSQYQATNPLMNDCVTMAEYFQSHKYRTAAFISQHYLDGSETNLKQGFDHYDAEYEEDAHGMSARRAVSVTDAAINWIGGSPGKPFFTWLVYFDPHDPYVPPPGFKGFYNRTEKYSGDRRAEGIGYERINNHIVTEEHGRFLINAYDEEIRYLDYEISRLFLYLKKCGTYENTIIIITADHGEELGEFENRWDHCQLLSQAEIWIPMLIKLPGQHTLLSVGEAVQSIDLYPTLIEYLEGSDLPGYFGSLEGKSFLPLMQGTESGRDRHAVSFWFHQQCIVQGNNKYWLRENEETFTNLQTGEEIEEWEVRDNLRRLLDQEYQRYISQEDYYSDTIQELKALGYLQ